MEAASKQVFLLVQSIISEARGYLLLNSFAVHLTKHVIEEMRNLTISVQIVPGFQWYLAKDILNIGKLTFFLSKCHRINFHDL